MLVAAQVNTLKPPLRRITSGSVILVLFRILICFAFGNFLALPITFLEKFLLDCCSYNENMYDFRWVSVLLHIYVYICELFGYSVATLRSSFNRIEMKRNSLT